MMNTRTILSLLAMLLLPAGAAVAQQPPYKLDTLQVEVASHLSARLPAVTRGVEVITAEEIRAAPARNVADLLGWALGLDVRTRSPAQADLSLRGGSFEQVLVLVNGVRMSSMQTGHLDLQLAVPLDEIARVEILRGPASALYGADAMGGVINIVTKRGGGGYARVEGGSFGTVGLALGGHVGGKTLGARVSGSFRRSDGHRPGTDYRVASVRTSIDARLGGRTLRADFAFAARDFGAKYFYLPATLPDTLYSEYEETRTAVASLVWAAPADAEFSIVPRLSVRRRHDMFVLKRDDPSFYRNVHTTWQLGGKLVARYRASPDLRVAAGVEAYRDLLESTNLGTRAESRAAAFAEVAAGRIGRATVTAGLRADWHSEYGGFLAPSLAGAWWPTDALRLRASLGRAFRAPSWTERYYNAPFNKGNPDLEPERSWSGEVGAELRPAPGIELMLAGFIRDAEDLIDWARPTGAADTVPWRTMNIEQATFRGLEFKASVADVLGTHWTLRAMALSFEATGSDGYTSKYALHPLTRSVSLTARRPLPAGFSVSARVLHARRAGADPYLRADLELGYEWGEARIYVDVKNVTDADYLDASRLPVPGRAIYVGVLWGG